MKRKAVESLLVDFERGADGWWTAQVREEPGAITQGRSLKQARTRIREALAALWNDDERAARVMLRDQVQLSPALQKALTRAIVAREKLELDVQAANESTRAAVKKLAGEGMSVRDVGDLLKLSPARVHQLRV